MLVITHQTGRTVTFDTGIPTSTPTRCPMLKSVPAWLASFHTFLEVCPHAFQHTHTGTAKLEF